MYSWQYVCMPISKYQVDNSQKIFNPDSLETHAEDFKTTATTDIIMRIKFIYGFHFVGFSAHTQYPSNTTPHHTILNHTVFEIKQQILQHNTIQRLDNKYGLSSMVFLWNKHYLNH